MRVVQELRNGRQFTGCDVTEGRWRLFERGLCSETADPFTRFAGSLELNCSGSGGNIKDAKPGLDEETRNIYRILCAKMSWE